MCLANGYKKSVETCRAHRTNGIAKHRSRNELRTNTPRCLYTLCKAQRRAVRVHIQNRMSVYLCLHPST